jgi:hypothetical protein
MRKCQSKAGAVVSLAVAICLCPAVSRGATVPAETDIVPAGPDMFVTQPGTFFDIPGVGAVNFLGVPNAQGADTIIQRLAAINVTDVPDAVGSTEMVPLKMTLLDLKSTAPVNIGGSFFDVFVTLNPNIASTGTLDLTQTVNGEGIPEGTFTTSIDVNFILSFERDGKTIACPLPSCADALSLTGNGLWTDDRGVDWILGGVRESHPGGGVHVAREIPEPGSLLLIGGGLLVGVLRKRLL